LIVLGLNAFHPDSSAALVKNGVLIAAVEEERFRRIKHWAGFPAQAIRYCLQEAKLTIRDVDHIAINQNSRSNFLRKAAYVLKTPSSLPLAFSRLKNRRSRTSVVGLLERTFGAAIDAQFHKIEHHEAHMSSAFHVSPFQDAVVVSVDGFGDFSSAAWGHGEDTKIDVAARVFFPHSLGVLYQAVTQFLGFPHYGDEYKVMGLAPYGRPAFTNEVRQLVGLSSNGLFELNLRFFRHHRDDTSFDWADGTPEFSDLFSPDLEQLLGKRRKPEDPLEARHHDIARSVQAVYEEAFFHMLTAAQRKSSSRNLALAGGCANNSVANGKVRRETPFDRVYVQSAAGDAGGAIGAAFSVWHKLGGARSFVMDHAYWGPEFSENNLAELLSSYSGEIEKAGCSLSQTVNLSELCDRTAQAIADGKVVGWFQGRMEWGPRALGNRSILGDPRRSDMKEILNIKIKRRESFRPFAPSILEEDVGDWFEEVDAVPFMMQVFQIREEKRARIPAVTHVDGSGRLQTVSQHVNPKYHSLIQKFKALTGVPMVLNTSFNENEPVVCKPSEAIECFLRTKMDVLVLGNTIVTRAS
jgi:carbamoyltransferase